MHKTPEITRLIHENFWLVMAFALSRANIDQLLEKRFHGEWKYLRKSFYELSEVRADRALLEMGTQLRVLDDEEDISDFLKQTKHHPFGTVTQCDGSVTEMHFRDVTNKIIHAGLFEWELSDPLAPKVICLPNAKEEGRWKKAEINLFLLAGLIGSLMF